MSAPSTAAVRGTASVIELELAAEAGPGWLGSGAEPVTVSLTAETVRFEGAHLHFITGNTVVRTVPRAEVTALTWRGSPPRGRGSGPHRNAGVMWTEQERARLTAEVLGDLSWIEISHRHERSVSAVRREAVRMRLVDELGRRLDEQPGTGAALSPGFAPAQPRTPDSLSAPVTSTRSMSTRSVSAEPLTPQLTAAGSAAPGRRALTESRAPAIPVPASGIPVAGGSATSSADSPPERSLRRAGSQP